MFTSNWVEKNANDYDELISAIDKGDEKSVESMLEKSSMSGWEAYPLYAAVTCSNKKIRQMMCDHYRKFDRYSMIVLKKIIHDWNTFTSKDKQIYETIIYELTSSNDLISNKTCGSILAQACELGNVEIVRVLIKQGVNLNFTEKTSKLVPLHLAILKNKTAVVDELVRAGANVNMSDNDGNRSLHFASKSGNLQIVEALLRHGAGLDCKNYSSKYTPLHIAVTEGNSALLEVLIKAGASVNLSAKNGKSPLHLACELGSLEIVEMLLASEADPDWKMLVTKYTPLFLAVEAGHQVIVERLLKAKADVNAVASDGKTPLYVALDFEWTDIVGMLIDHDADPHVKDSKKKSTLLHTAASYDKKVVVTKLVEMGVDTHARDIYGKTPLHVAARNGRDAVQSLVSLGADKYLEDCNGQLPLHEALSENNVEAVDILFDINVLRHNTKFRELVSEILKFCLCPSSCSVRSKDGDRVLMQLIRFEAINVKSCDNDDKLKRHKIFGRNYYKECLAEVQQLKTFFLVSDCVSLYDYLHMKPKCRLAYVQSIPSELTNFEQYGSLIEEYTNEAVARKSLFDSTKKALYELTDIFVPDICVERISDFLNVESLKNLSNVLISSS